MSNLIERYNRYRTNNSKSLMRYQKMFGYPMSVYRIVGDDSKKLVDAYGASRVRLKDVNKYEFIKEIYSVAFPTELYKSLHSNSAEVDIYISDNDLKMGDLIRFQWIDTNVLDYYVSALPETWGTIFYKYRLTSNFNILQNTNNKK